MPNSRIELSRAAAHHNQKWVRAQLREGVELAVVVKGNAYGHGIREFVPLAMEAGCDRFAVYSDHEAQELVEVTGPGCSLMVMGDIELENLPWIIRNGIEFYVFELGRLNAAIEAARACGRKVRIHLELETGMNRTGVTEEDLPFYVQRIRENRDLIRLEGICSHLAGSESIANHVRVTRQMELFHRLVDGLRQSGVTAKRLHMACSAAALRYPESQLDMVRSGILNYGFWPSRELMVQYLDTEDGIQDPLKRVVSWKSYLMSTKTVRKGEFVGYGMSFLSYESRRIGIVPVGYAHGYARALSNLGVFLVRGRRVPVIGMVNMNATTVDLSAAPDAQVGDEVVVIGTSGDTHASVSSFGERTQQVNYEVLSHIPPSVPRQVVD